jgi:KUP system potassium uptake protein
MKEELSALVESKHAGVVYIMGHSYMKARKSSNVFKKFVIDMACNFLRKNCRPPLWRSTYRRSASSKSA